ncbi:uncharacterized protein LOC106707966 [Papilio machaon]|uniref:uncharacterized protein LOC106707966 n=1 Tax=Papilio machaon TaxID=76193 RepID=UPI001E665927|nr:uncharacterized protein LOC106707966 [Papilio machaon]
MFKLATANVTGQHITSEIGKPRNDHSKDLLIILVTPKAKFKTSDLDFDDISSEFSEDSSQEEESESLTPKEDEAYFLYHMLRTTENSQQIDNKTASTIMQTKEILQPILRSRCKKLDNCKKKCPKRKKSLCEKKCIMMIDIFIVCEKKPKNKCKKKCGKTMPPSWR